MNEGAALTVDELMTHAAWLGRLARSLVGDGADAADAAQDAVVAALQSPPDARGSRRAWFGRVLLNRIRSTARSERRRHTRDQAAAERDPLPTPEEVVLGLEMQRH